MTTLQIKDVPTQWLPKLLQAQSELQGESQNGFFGLQRPPCWVNAGIGAESRGLQSHDRIILGHKWTMPQTRSSYPLTVDEEMNAPWPWQVQQGLDDLSRAIFREVDRRDHAEVFLNAALGLPSGTDDEALLFLRITEYPSHFKTIRTMQRWHQIICDPQKRPRAVAWIASEIGEAMRLWDHPKSRQIGDVIIYDILAKSTDSATTWNAMASYLRLHHVEGWEREQGKSIPASPTLNHRFLEIVLDASRGSDWTRVYHFSLLLAPLLDRSPLNYEGIRDHADEAQSLEQDLSLIRSWFEHEKPIFIQQAQKESSALEQTRKFLTQAK